MSAWSSDVSRADLAETGSTIMVMEAGLDTGPMLLRDRVPIGPKTTATDQQDALAAMGARLVVDALDGFADGRLRPEPQPKEGVTYAPKNGKEEIGRASCTERVCPSASTSVVAGT